MENLFLVSKFTSHCDVVYKFNFGVPDGVCGFLSGLVLCFIDDLLFSGCSAVDIYSVLEQLLQLCHVFGRGCDAPADGFKNTIHLLICR